MSDKSVLLVQEISLRLLGRGITSQSIRFNEEFVAELERAGAEIVERDLGDGAAPPEENFWDDRTTPHAYGESDALREQAARERILTLAQRDSAFIDASRETFFTLGWNARSRYEG